MCVCRKMRPRRVPSAILLPLELSWKVVVLSYFGVGFQRSFLLAVIATGLPLCLGAAWVRVCTLFGLRGRRKASESEQCDDVFAPLSDRFRLLAVEVLSWQEGVWLSRQTDTLAYRPVCY